MADRLPAREMSAGGSAAGRPVVSATRAQRIESLAGVLALLWLQVTLELSAG